MQVKKTCTSTGSQQNFQLSHLEFHQKVTEGLVGNIQNKMNQKKGTPSST
jgi:hypothetical protein